MKISKDLAISDSGFVFNPATGESFTVNEVGMLILNSIKNNMTEQEILKKITEEYEVSEVEAERDLIDFKAMMKMYKILID